MTGSDTRGMTTPSEPQTEAGRSLLEFLTNEEGWDTDLGPTSILAIEAEARAPLGAEIERLRRLLAYLWNEADIEPGHAKVCDLFGVDDPLSLDITAALEPSDGR